MNKRYIRLSSLIFLFLLFIGDLQISTLLSNILPFFLSISCFQTILFLLVYSQIDSSVYTFFLSIFIGFVYDIYFYNALGIAVCLFPFLTYLIYYFFQAIRYTRLSMLTVFIVLIFLFEIVSYGLARLFGLTNLSVILFSINHLIPTLLFNMILILFLYPLIKRGLNRLN
ncbi:rod shape-determining protein MreD [Streptococcus sp. DD13]|uniref:rod shape-determining protein MreD n=1 Tax=Streptococcus sp. DD13 TaxID=1777881 RepID=UPI00082C96AC